MIRQLQSIKPDVVLVDVQMTGWDGRLLVNEIRACEQGQNTPLIAIMSDGDAELLDVINYPVLVTQSSGLEVRKVTHLIPYKVR